MKKIRNTLLAFCLSFAFAFVSAFGQLYKSGSNGLKTIPDWYTYTSYQLPGDGYRFDAASSQGLVDNDGSDFQIKDWGAGSICIWGKSSSSDVMKLIGKGSSSIIANDFLILAVSNQIRFALRHSTSNIIIIKAAALDGNWFHAAFTFDTTGYFKAYYNGVIYDSADISSFNWSTANTNKFSLGYNGVNTNYLTGDLRDARVFKRQITASEVKKIYETGQRIGDEYRWYSFQVDSCYDMSGNDVGLTKTNFNANSYITGSWTNPMNLYGFTNDTIPFDNSTIDNFGTATQAVDGTFFERYILKQ